MGHVSCISDQRKQVQSLSGKPEGNRSLRTPVSVDGRIILECVLNSTGELGLFFVVPERDRFFVVLYLVMKFCEHDDEC